MIEQPEIVKKILKHLGLWEVEARPPPKQVNAPTKEIHTDYSLRGLDPSGPEAHSQVPLFGIISIATRACPPQAHYPIEIYVAS